MTNLTFPRAGILERGMQEVKASVALLEKTKTLDTKPMETFTKIALIEVTKYLNLTAALEVLPEGCSQFMKDHWDAVSTAPGSGSNHQFWFGGYLGHLDELFGISALMYRAFSSLRPLPFKLTDAFLVLFLHDVEKAFKRLPEGVERNFAYETAAHSQKQIQQMVIDDYQLIVTEEMKNALEYVHGEGDDYRKDSRVAGPLAAFVHNCDYFSARVWHDEPRKSGILPNLQM
jgi:hypothetical protein